MMRLAVVSPGYPPTLGGVETLVQATSTTLARVGVQVDVLTQDPKVMVANVTEDRGVVIRRFAARGGSRFPVSSGLRTFVSGHGADYDIVHLHNFHSSVVLWARQLDAGQPLVFSPHFHGGGHTPATRLMHVPYRRLVDAVIRRCDRFVHVSEAERALWSASYPAESARSFVVPNGVDTADITGARPFPDEPPTVLVLGRLEGYKRIDRVIDGFGVGERLGQLVVVGAGPAEAALREHASRSPAARRIRFTGRLDRSEVVRWLRTASVVVSLSEHEAFGLTVLEAAAAGARAVLSAIPAHREVAGMVSGATLVDADASASDIAGAMEAALGRPSRPESVRDWADVAADYLRHYDDVLRSTTA